MPFDFLDICALLSNALDNAIEVCVRQMVNGEAIALRVNFQHGFLKLELSNPISDAHVVRQRMMRREGRGLPIIRNVVDRYDGVLSISIQDNQYTLSVMLQEPFR